MNIEPLSNRVVVRRVEEANVSKGGIYIPPSAVEKSTEGVVTAVGPRCEQVTKGDRVIFGKYSGSEISLNDEIFHVMREEDVIAIIRS